MSGNTFTCRDRYFNYGSYLRSRGYDKEICNLIVAIEQGQFPIGPIYPGNCSKRITTTIKGNVDIVPCLATDNKPNATPSTPISGQLTVTGGFIGAGGIDVSNGTNIPTLVAQQAVNYGIQSLTGISSRGGPIYQQTDCSHSNWFGAKNHVFVGGTGDCSTNVIVRGNLFVDGTTVELNGFVGETLTLVTLPGNAALGTLNTFKSPISNGNMVDMYTEDISSVSLLSGSNQWKNYLSFAIDGNSSYPQTDICGIDVSAGMSNVMGHMRGFRGLTITNPPSGTPVDIEWNPDIIGTNRAIDAYGSIRVQPGNTDGTGSAALGNIDISGGQFRIFQNDISNIVLFSTGDASFNGRVSCYDLSVTNIATFGASTTYIDTSNVNTSYVTVDNSLNTHFIYTPSSNDMYINAGSGGTFSDIYMNANNIFMDSDLSVNDISSSNINNTGLINTNSITAQSMIIDDISTNHISVYDLSVTNFLVVDGDISANGAISGVSFTDGIATLSAGALSNATTVTASGLVTAGSGNITDLSVNTLQSKAGADLAIKAGITGTFQDIYMNANNIFMDSDLSVNDISSSNINNTGLINTNSITAQSMVINDISTNHISVYDLSVTNFLVVDGDISANGAISGVSFTDGIATLSAGALSNALTIQAISGEFTDISVNTHASIYDLSVVNMHTVGTSTTTIDTNSIQANSGDFIDISVNNNIQAENFIGCNWDISAGRVVSAPLGDFGYIQQTEPNGSIKTYQISSWPSSNIDISAGSGNVIFKHTNNVIMSNSDLSAGDISANIIQAANFILNDGNTFTDLSSTVSSLNTYVNVLDISVNGLETTILNYDTSFNSNLIVGASGEFTDISVNSHAYIYDLSVNGDSVFTGNFLINNITGGSEAITIQTNGGTNENITIRNGQGNKDDSININSAAGGVNISAGSLAPITFSAKDIIMSNSDLSANDISANNIQALGYITSGGDITTTSSIIAGSASITDLLTAGSGNISDLSVNTLQSKAGADLAIKAGITGTFQDIKFSAKDIIMSSSDLSAGDISANNIQANNFILTGGNTFNDLSSNVTELRSTVTDLSSNVTDLRTTVTDLSSNVTDLRTTVTDLSSNVTELRSTVTDLSSNVTLLDTSVFVLDASMAIVEKVASLRYRAVSSSASYSVGAYDNIQSFDTSDISNNMSMSISGLPSNKGEISIPYTGIYSYNLQLDCSANSNVTSIGLAINDNSANSPGVSNVNIANAGQTGGVNRRYDISGSNTIGLSGISKFASGNEVQLYIKVSGTGGSVTLDNANQSIFTMALLYATD